MINENIIKFKGEFRHGFLPWNGIIKEYFDNYNLSFEGNYKNGERNGEGIEYYDNGKI